MRFNDIQKLMIQLLSFFFKKRKKKSTLILIDAGSVNPESKLIVIMMMIAGQCRHECQIMSLTKDLFVCNK